MTADQVAAPPRSEPQPGHPRVRRGSDVPVKPDVSIIVLVTSDTDRLQRCLASISAAADGGPVTEVLVLANGTPSSALINLDDREDIVLIRSAVNHGFGGGCNWAASFARGARLVFINDDALATAGWLAALSRVLDADPSTGVVGSRVLLSDGRLQEAGNVIWRDGGASHLGKTLPADEPRLLARRQVDYVSFCSAMVRRETWEQVGGFDRRYFPAYFEDADFCMSARALGWGVACEPASVVIHEGGASTSLRFRSFLSGRNQRLFAAKWASSLAGFDPRPKRLNARLILKAALRKQHREGADVVSDRWTASATSRAIAGATHAPGTRDLGEIDEAEVVALEMAHLAEHLAIKDEYAAFLAAQLDAFGATDLARKAYRAIRGGLSRQERRLGFLARTREKRDVRARGRQ